MTRTARAIYPRALAKDASLSRNGRRAGARKGGAGAHNWGVLLDEHLGPSVRKARPVVARVVSSEERARALSVRKRFSKGEVNLSEIARSSIAVSGSAPSL